MAEGIPGPPNNYPAGLEFDYSVWTPGTTIDLVNVPWNNDYRDVVRYDTRAEFDAYISGLPKTTITQLTYAKPNEDIYLNIPFNRVSRFNYLRASNPLMPIEGDIQKNYYYFIIGCEYISPMNTRLRLQLDVWSTYIHDVEFGNCYVERGHIAIANTNQFNNYGQDYLTVPEGMDLGNEYKVVTTRTKYIMTLTPVTIGDRYPGFDVLVISSTDLLADPGTPSNPSLKSASGTTFQGTSQGASFYIFDPQSFEAYMNSMQDSPWVTQGIMSITMIPKMNRYYPGFAYGTFPLPADATTLYPRTIGHDIFPGWRDNNDYTGYIPERYAHLKKLKTYPYTAVELTTFGATPVIIKPEAWNNADARLFERASLLPPGQRIEFSPRFYNSRNDDEGDLPDLYPPPVTGYEFVKGDDEGDYVDVITQIANFPTMSIVNNGQISYLAANVHGIAFQYKSADWAQQRALAGAQAGYDVATGAISASSDVTGLALAANTAQMANQNRTLAAQAAVNATAQAVSGIGNALTPGGFGGAAISGLASGAATGINAGIQTQANDESLAVSNNQLAQTNTRQNEQGRLARDTNTDLARYAARGDYANTVAGINAKVQDAQLIQPSTSGQVGGETMNMVNGGWPVSLRFKMINQAQLRIIGEFWLRYGYAIHSFIKPPASLKVMTRFTYWKMQETYISASMVPEGHKQAIRGILEKGVTVWDNPLDIGVIDIADNDALPGVSY